MRRVFFTRLGDCACAQSGMSISCLVFSVWGRVCVLRLWVSMFPQRGSWASGLFFASLGRSATVFVRWMYPGPVASHAGFDPPTPPPGVVESALLLARDVQSAVPYLRSSGLLHASRRRLQRAVCCFRWIGSGVFPFP